MAAHARALLRLFVVTGALLATVAVPACPQLSVQVRSGKQARPGGKLAVTAKVSNTGKSTLTSVGVRIDLPAGFVAYPSKSRKGPALAGRSAYWQGLTLGSKKHRAFRLKALACSTLTSGAYYVSGAAYVMPNSSAVDCLTPATPSTVR